jgi:hypothetical protein
MAQAQLSSAQQLRAGFHQSLHMLWPQLDRPPLFCDNTAVNDIYKWNVVK